MIKKKVKLYCIKKVWISDGLISSDVELFRTKMDRDKAWAVLVHDHNNMIQEAYNIDLSDYSYEEDYYYEWSQESLEFYDKAEPECHHDLFEVGEVYV